MTEGPLFFECNECGYDSGEANVLLSGEPELKVCPMCAGDTGKDGDMRYRAATEMEIVAMPVRQVRPWKWRLP